MKILSIAALLILVCSFACSPVLHAQGGGFTPGRIKELKDRYGKQMANALEPTHPDIAYGQHERNKLDLWKAESKQPTPVLVYIHGGGFRLGDKKMIHAQIPVRDYLKQGISCISVNYPFLQHTNRDLGEIYRHAGEALDFIIEHAAEWNIDPERISLAGASAGAAISQTIGYSTDKVHSLVAFNQPMRTDKMILPHVKKGGPPTFIYHENDLNDRMHPPECAKMLKRACDNNGIECHLYGTGANSIEAIPDGKTPEAAVLEFLLEQWK